MNTLLSHLKVNLKTVNVLYQTVDGISHKHVLNMCNLYKDYLSTAAQATANEQVSLID